MPDDGYLKRTEVRIDRTFPARAARLFHAWTDPESMSRWMWAGLGGDVWAERDLRVGGAYRIYTRAAGGTHQGLGWSGMCGLYVEIEPVRKLVYTVHWDADVFYNRPGNLTLDEVVSVTFTPADDATHMAFVHMGIPDIGSSAAEHRAGIAASFDLLAQIL